MEEGSQKTIYVDKDESVTEIVDKIKNSSDYTVNLIVPDGAMILQDVVNLKILQKKAEEFGKEVTISKMDKKAIQDKKVIHEESAKKPTKMLKNAGYLKRPSKAIESHMNLGRISDMVKKKGTIDLRNMDVKSRVDDGFSNGSSDDFVSDVPTEEDANNVKDSSYHNPVSEDSSDRYPDQMDNSVQEHHDDIEFWAADKEYDHKKEEFQEDRMSSFFEGDSNEKDRRKRNIEVKDSAGVKNKYRKSVLPTLSSRFFAVFIMFCLVTAGLALFIILPKADVSIVLKSENISGDFDFSLSQDITEVDFDQGKIPVNVVEITSEKNQVFEATGRKVVSEKATGEIIVYNECSTATQTLVANTRFLSKDGKIFKIEEGITIPGFTKPEDSVIPGQKKVKVVAEETGSSYNIGATTFTIPKLQELVSWKYSCLYARSDSSMTGGMEKEVSYITQSDYDSAKESLVKLARGENTQKISESRNEGDNFVIDIQDDDSEQITSEISLGVGEIADNFTVTVLVKEDITIAKKSDLEGVVEKDIVKLANYGEAKPVENSLFYEIKSSYRDGDDILVSVSATEDFVFYVDSEKVKKDVCGSNENELEEYFNEMEGIESVNINLWPFWVTKVPDSCDKINITIDISDSI